MRKLKTFVYLSAILFGILAVSGMVWAGQFSDLDKDARAELKEAIKIQKKAHKIHHKILTVDTHLDTPLVMDFYPTFFEEEFDLGRRYQNADLGAFTFRQVDFPRMEEGGLDAGFFVAYVAQGVRDDAGNQAAIEKVLGLIDHIAMVAGIDHVGIGTDFDGGGVVAGCEDASKLEAITLELVKRGYKKKEIHKIWSGNIMRVFREVQDIAGN